MTAEKVIVTSAGPNMQPVLDHYALPTFERFAEAHGYDIHVERLDADSEQRDEAAKQARWQKIPILRKMLERGDHELVLWMDADILVCRADEDIADRLHPDCFQALPLESYPSEHRVNPTTSVWLLRNNEISLDFLKEAEEMGVQPGPWADQGVVMRLLGWEVGEENYRWARPGQGTRFTPLTAILPEGWNQSYKAFRPGPDYYADRSIVWSPHVLHFHGMSIEERSLAMASVSRELGYADNGDGFVPDEVEQAIPKAALLKPATVKP